MDYVNIEVCSIDPTVASLILYMSIPVSILSLIWIAILDSRLQHQSRYLEAKIQELSKRTPIDPDVGLLLKANLEHLYKLVESDEQCSEIVRSFQDLITNTDTGEGNIK